MKKLITIYCVAAAIVLFMISFIYVDEIFDLLYAPFRKHNMFFLVSSVSGSFGMALRLSLAIGLLPIFLMIAWIKGNISSPIKIIGSIAIALAIVTIAILLNEIRLQSYAIPDLPQVKVAFPIEGAFFERAIVSGAAVGSIISYFIFRTRRPNSIAVTPS